MYTEFQCFTLSGTGQKVCVPRCYKIQLGTFHEDVLGGFHLAATSGCTEEVKYGGGEDIFTCASTETSISVETVSCFHQCQWLIMSMCILSLNFLLLLELVKKFSVVVGVESNFCVHLWSKP